MTKTAARWQGMTLRNVVALTLATLLLLSLTMGKMVWDAWQDHRYARLTGDTNQLADHIIAAAAFQALERGFTANALSAATEAPPAMRERIAGYRAAGEKEFAAAMALAGRLTADRQGSPLAAQALELTLAAHANVQAARAKVDASLAGSRRDIAAADWLKTMTGLIQQAARLRQIVFSHPRIAPGVTYANLTAKHRAWLAAENAGLERANVAAQINGNTPAVSTFFHRMEGLRSIVDGAVQELLRLGEAANADVSVKAAVDDMKLRFLNEFEALRRQVYYEAEQPDPMGSDNHHYSITATQWFDASTKGIDSLLAVATAISRVAEADAAALGRAALARLALFVTLFAGTVLVGAVMAAQLLVKLRQIAALKQSMDDLAQGEGDLTRRLPVAGGDEIGTTSATFNEFLGQLHAIISEVQRDVDQVSAAAGRLAANSRHIEQSSQEQSEAASATAAAVEQITVSIGHVAESSRETAEVSRDEDQLAAAGEHTVREFAEEIRAIAGAVSESAQQVEELGSRSHAIGSIVNVIKEIAEQTNLLALNAAIEAARAGEQGRGFAVVADEVRKLAERTSGATREISAMIASIQDGTRKVVVSMTAHRNQIQGGVERARDAAQTLAEIRAGARKTMERVADIVHATDEQSGASKEIARNVETIARMSEANVGTVRETAAAARDLERLAADLKDVAGRFRV